MRDNWHEIFIAGNYPQGSFSESYLDEVVANFERNKTAGIPMTLDHKKEGQAYGWVGKIKRVGNKLLSTFSDVTTELKEAVREKRYKNISVSFHPQEPRLMEVSFLGARLPQLKSLPSPQFSLPDDLVCIEFAENTDPSEDDQDFYACTEDDMSEGDYDSDDNKIERYRAIVKDQNKKIVELETQLADIKENPEFYEQQKENPLTEREIEFREELAQYKTMFDQSQRQAKDKEINEFCDKLFKEGKIGGNEHITKYKRILMNMDDTNTIEFSDGYGKVEKLSSYEILKKDLESFPVQWSEEEIVTDTTKTRYDFSERYDGKNIEIEAQYSKIKRIARQRGIDPNDPIKISELIREVANESQKNSIDFEGGA